MHSTSFSQDWAVLSQHPVAFLCVVIGSLFWLGSYALALILGFRQRTYGLPLAAILMNFTWEGIASFLRPAPFYIWHIGAYLWFVLDVVIVLQIFLYGRNVQVIPEMRRWFYPVVVVSMAGLFFGQFLFSRYIRDEFTYVFSYLINAIMSILFVFRYFTVRDHGNPAYGVAITKMLGTGIISVGLVFLWPVLYPGRTHFIFMKFMFVGVFLLDVLYVRVLQIGRRGGSASTGGDAQPGDIAAT